MTEPTPEPQAPAEASENVTEPPADLPQDIEQARALRRENQTLRARARQAEEALEGALARAANLEQAQIREYASEILHDPDDLLKAQPDAQEFFDSEFGGITRSRVVESARVLAADRPWLLKPPTPTAPPSDRPIEGLRPGARAVEPERQPSWSDAIRGT